MRDRSGIFVVLFLIVLLWGGAAQADSNDWKTTVKTARGSTVRLFMYGGSQPTNAYFDDYVAPAVKKRYGITLVRTPLADTGDVVNKLLAAKMAGRKKGGVDLVWINGENFAAGAKAGLWRSGWARSLPNARYIDWDNPQINRDFGVPVKGREAPWSFAQFVMIYDSAEVSHPPRTPAALAAWVAAHPGRFTYPAPPAYTGNAFIEQMLFFVTNQHSAYLERFNPGLFNRNAPRLWRFLNRIKPDLWRHGQTYPASAAALDKLYQTGEVDFTMNYNPAYAQRQIDKGLFPKSTRTYVFESGTLANTSYMAMPASAPNSAGAKVVANFLESPAAQRIKQNPKRLGDLTILDTGRLSPEQRRGFKWRTGPALLPRDTLESHRLQEADSSWIEPLQDGWRRHVAP